MALVDEGTTEKEEWIVTWFPPEAMEKKKGFSDEAKARRFAAKQDVAEWNPLLEHVITLTAVTSELLPL